jgi:hypothetical protein
MARALTANEARYVQAFVRRTRKMFWLVLGILLLSLGALLAGGSWIVIHDRKAIAGMVIGMLIMTALLGPLIIYFFRRLARPWRPSEVESFGGRFETRVLDAGEGSANLYYIDGRSVTFPEHWSFQEGELVTVEACSLPMRGIDTPVHGDRIGLLITVQGRFSVDREVSLGLLGAQRSPSSALMMALLAAAGLFSFVLGLATSNDTRLLLRHWRGRDATQVFGDVRSVVRAPPPERAHIEIARANLVIGFLGADFPESRLIDTQPADFENLRELRPRLMWAARHWRDGEWRQPARQFWLETLARHEPNVMEVSSGTRRWRGAPLEERWLDFEEGFRQPNRYRGTFTSWTREDGSVGLRLALGDPAPPPAATSLQLLLGGATVLVGLGGLLLHQRARRRRILARLKMTR